MNDAALKATGELAEMLAAPIDPRAVPVRFSTLKQFARSPLHYWHAVQSGYDETASMRLGSGVHAMLFGQPVTRWGGKTRNGKEWDAFQAANPKTTILNGREWSEAEQIVASILRNPLALSILRDGEPVVEQRIDWTWQGRAFRSTPDVRAADRVVDLKTTRCAEPEKFARSAIWMGYHAQLALYLDAVRESQLGTPREAFVVAVESAPPYPVTVLRLTERALDQGRRLCRLWFERLLQCEAANEWPGYVQSIAELDVPNDDPDDLGLIFGDAENEES